jgi:hypothetical protein
MTQVKDTATGVAVGVATGVAVGEVPSMDAETQKVVSEVEAAMYPLIGDPSFSQQLAQKQEFHETPYDGRIRDIRATAEELCHTGFEILPHQLFVKNFLSLQTPYNALLLYHGLGSGKTCSAIGVCEEMRQYIKQMGVQSGNSSVPRILVVASPNVQENFRLQLFDPNRLRFEHGQWNLRTCVGADLLGEIDPTRLPTEDTVRHRESIVRTMNNLINKYYKFMGYIQLGNYITKVATKGGDNPRLRRHNLRQRFSHRLIVIDEVHNIRIADDNPTSKTVAKALLEVVKTAENVRLLMMTATPLYNSYKEVVWWTNLLNAVDGRSEIKVSDVFDARGNFVPAADGQEGGRELLVRKLTGYVSYVRGENPYTFPYRVVMGNGHVRTDNEDGGAWLHYSPIGSAQRRGYQLILDATFAKRLASGPSPSSSKTSKASSKTSKASSKTSKLSLLIVPDADASADSNSDLDLAEEVGDLDGLNYEAIQGPIQALNMVYPTLPIFRDEEAEMAEAAVTKRTELIGKQGLRATMDSREQLQGVPERDAFQYKPGVERLFAPENIGKYSGKIATITAKVRESTGIVLIYSQYIDGGLVPMALALEEMGFTRYVSDRGGRPHPLFLNPPRGDDLLDALTMQPRSTLAANPNQFRPAQYVMITGDKAFSHDNVADLGAVVHPDNRYGANIKVVLISKAASEGLDFKNIRQIHLMEPWYNLNRAEQIIGRGVRNLSHCALPFEERNVEIYLHATTVATTVAPTTPAPTKSEEIGDQALADTTPTRQSLKGGGDEVVPVPKPSTEVPNPSIAQQLPPPGAMATPPPTTLGNPSAADIPNPSAADVPNPSAADVPNPSMATPPPTTTLGNPSAAATLGDSSMPKPSATAATAAAATLGGPSMVPEPNSSMTTNVSDITVSSSQTKPMTLLETIFGTGTGNKPDKIEESVKAAAPLTEETVDQYIYRMAYRKAAKIGQVTRLIKTVAVDCVLHLSQTHFTVERLQALAANQRLKIRLSSSRSLIDFQVGDRPYSDLCDYQSNCAFQCNGASSEEGTEPPRPLDRTTYMQQNTLTNLHQIVDRVKQLFRESPYYQQLPLIRAINVRREYPIDHIYAALTHMIEQRTNTLTDRWGRAGYLINRGDTYLFQPTEVTDEAASLYERTVPVPYRPEHVAFEIPNRIVPNRTDVVVPPPPPSTSAAAAASPKEAVDWGARIRAQVDQALRGAPSAGVPPKNWDWYDHAASVLTEDWRRLHGWKEADLEDALVAHALDALMPDERLQAATTGGKTYPAIQRYLEARWQASTRATDPRRGWWMMVVDNRRGELSVTRKLFVSDTPRADDPAVPTVPSVPSVPLKSVWGPGAPEDIDVFFPASKSVAAPPRARLADLIGYWSLFDHQQMVFKVRDLTQKRNTGARMDSAGKTKVIGYLNRIQSMEIYTEASTKPVLLAGLCVLLEMMMRQPKGPGSKRAFLTPEEALLLTVDDRS